VDSNVQFLYKYQSFLSDEGKSLSILLAFMLLSAFVKSPLCGKPVLASLGF